VRAESDIERLTREIARLDVTLASPDLFARGAAEAATIAKARAAAASALASAENDWLEASAAYESDEA